MSDDHKFRLLDQRVVRPLAALTVTATTAIVFDAGDDAVTTWAFLAPVVVLFWAWTLGQHRRSGHVHLLGLTMPLVSLLASADGQVAMAISVVTAFLVSAFTANRRYVRNVIGLFMFMTSLLGVTEAVTQDFSWPSWLFTTALAWGAGELVWRFTGTVGELEHTRSLVADQAALNERQRIARDVHDLVGHSLSVVMMHVAGARLLVRSDPDEAERALVQAENAGRQSLAEIRRTIGLLRDDTDPAAPVLPSAELADVHELIHDLAAAGQMVDLDISGDIATIDAPTSLAAYRITQEALTNATRHTVNANIAVSISVDSESCDIAVNNHGGEVLDLGQGSGFGLISMRERAKSVGGSLVAGPTRDGWTVDVSLPVESVRSRT